MTSIVHSISHASLAQCAAAGAALLPETCGVRVTGTDLEVWTADAPLDAVQNALGHVEVVWRACKQRSVALFEAAQEAQGKANRARTVKSRTKATEICATAWADYSRACAEVDAIEDRGNDLRTLITGHEDLT